MGKLIVTPWPMTGTPPGSVEGHSPAFVFAPPKDFSVFAPFFTVSKGTYFGFEVSGPVLDHTVDVTCTVSGDELLVFSPTPPISLLEEIFFYETPHAGPPFFVPPPFPLLFSPPPFPVPLPGGGLSATITTDFSTPVIFLFFGAKPSASVGVTSFTVSAPLAGYPIEKAGTVVGAKNLTYFPPIVAPPNLKPGEPLPPFSLGDVATFTCQSDPPGFEAGLALKFTRQKFGGDSGEPTVVSEVDVAVVTTLVPAAAGSTSGPVPGDVFLAHIKFPIPGTWTVEACTKLIADDPETAVKVPVYLAFELSDLEGQIKSDATVQEASGIDMSTVDFSMGGTPISRGRWLNFVQQIVGDGNNNNLTTFVVGRRVSYLPVPTDTIYIGATTHMLISARDFAGNPLAADADGNELPLDVPYEFPDSTIK